jgi:hypothetical protein
VPSGAGRAPGRLPPQLPQDAGRRVPGRPGATGVPLGSQAPDRYLGNAGSRILWTSKLTDEEGAA